MQTVQGKFQFRAEAPPAGRVGRDVHVDNADAALAVFAALLADVTFLGASGIVPLQVDAPPVGAAGWIELGPGQTPVFLQDVGFALGEPERLASPSGNREFHSFAGLGKSERADGNRMTDPRSSRSFCAWALHLNRRRISATSGPFATIAIRISVADPCMMTRESLRNANGL